MSTITETTTPKLNIDEYKKLLEKKSDSTVKVVDENNKTEINSIDFLTMLTTQLKYQDPMNPVNNDQFLNQMNQLTSTQTLQKMSASLDDIKNGFSSISDALSYSSKSMNNSSLIGMMNRTVSVLSDKLTVTNALEGVDINYVAPVGTSNMTIEIKDSLGRLVKEINVGQTSTTSENNDYVWDGRNSDGEVVYDGVYTLTFKDSNGDEISGTGIGVDGKVEGVKFSGDEAMIVVNNTEYSVKKIREIK